MAPWRGPRHRSWAANANIATIAWFLIFVTYCVWEIIGVAPIGLTTLLGTASGAWFASVSSDKRKKEDDIAADAAVAKEKVERLERVAVAEHGEAMATLDPNATDLDEPEKPVTK